MPDTTTSRSAPRSIEQQLRDLHARKRAAVDKLKAREHVLQQQLIQLTAQRETAEQQLSKVARALDHDAPPQQLTEEGEPADLFSSNPLASSFDADIAPELAEVERTLSR